MRNSTKHIIIAFVALLSVIQTTKAIEPSAGVSGNLTVRNCIIYNDSILNETGNGAVVTYSAVNSISVPTGAGNIAITSISNIKDHHAAPANSTSYYLSPTETLNNAGINISNLPTKDINGNDRLFDGTIDIGAIEYSLVYDKGTNDWSNSAHWNIGRIPTSDDVIAIRNNVLVNTSDAICKKIIEISTGKTLTINAGMELTVNESIQTANQPDKIVIKASSTTTNGSLIFHNTATNPVSATVEMYSKSSWDLNQPVNQKYNWQFFGIPVKSIAPADVFNGGYVRRKIEHGTTISNHWVSITADSTMYPFVGYEMCFETPRTISFKGELVNSNYNSGILPVTATALYPGQHLLSNPYTAAIDIRQIDFGAEAEQTVYQYNTGTFAAWSNLAGSDGTSPGQYIAASKAFAGVFAGIPRQVPSMGAMLIRPLSNGGANYYVNIPYSAVVMKNNESQRIKSNTESDNFISTLIEVKSKLGSDKMCIITDDNYTKDFDNGADGRKILGLALIPQIYAAESDGNYQINATNDINNTVLGFQAGQDDEYTITFTQQNVDRKYEKLYLYDVINNSMTDITASGSTYTFSVSEASRTTINRFRILTKQTDIDNSGQNNFTTFVSDNKIYVQNGSPLVARINLFDLSGRKIQTKQLAANDVESFNVKPQQTYIIQATTEDEDFSQKIIIQ